MLSPRVRRYRGEVVSRADTSAALDALQDRAAALFDADDAQRRDLMLLIIDADNRNATPWGFAHAAATARVLGDLVSRMEYARERNAARDAWADACMAEAQAEGGAE